MRVPGHVHAGRLRLSRDRSDPRQERQPHYDDELHGLWCRHAGLLADWICNTRRWRRRGSELGQFSGAEPRVRRQYLRQALRALGLRRILPDAQRLLRRLRDGAVPVPDGVYGYSAHNCDWYRSRAVEVRRLHSFLLCDWRLHLSFLRELGLGWRLAGQPGCEFRFGPWLCGLCRFRSGTRGRRHHCPGNGNDNRTPDWQVYSGRQAGCDTWSQSYGRASWVLYSGIRLVRVGFNRGWSVGASRNGNLRIGSSAVNTMLAGMTGAFGAMMYMWLRYGKPDASMTGNGLLAGLVAITAPSGFVNPVGACVIGLIAGVLVCLSVEFVERVMKVDDPVGAVSVHGTNGLWGVIWGGLVAGGKSNYRGS